MTHAMFLVLIVEDDAGIRSVLRMLLESQQYRVVEAETAARGTIEARNQSQGGAEFIVWLPFVREPVRTVDSAAAGI